MPTVLRVHGFRIAVLFPPREHRPPHVHVMNATGVVVVELADGDRPQRVRRIDGMSRADVRRAERIVTEHARLLLDEWRRVWVRQEP